MKPELQRRVQRYGWDYSSPHYDEGWQRQLRPAQKRLLEATALQAGEKVLDISCGTGLVTFPMAEKIMPGGEVTGIDLSEGMIEKAASLKKEKGLNNVTFRPMDAEDLKLPGDSFDVVVNSLGLMYYPAPDRAVGEMYRVLKKGGRATALVWGRRKQCGWAGIFPIVDQRVKTDVCPLFFQLGTGENLADLFRKSGFQQVATDRFDLSLHFESANQALVGAFQGGAVALAYRKFDEPVKEEVHREYLESIRPWRNGEGYDIPGEFVIVTGQKK